MNARHPNNHKANVSFNGTHKITSEASIHDDNDELKEVDGSIGDPASPLLFLSENSKFDADPNSSDAGTSSAGLSSESSSALPCSVRVKKTRGKQKINIEFIQEKNKRYTTFSKRKTGLMKKAHELSSLTGAEVLLLVASETNHVYTFATAKLRNMIQSDKGKELIRTCLACDEKPSSSNQPPRPTTHSPVSLASQVLPTMQEHQPQQSLQQQAQHPAPQQVSQALTQVTQATMLPTTSLSHILLPQTQDTFSAATSYASCSVAQSSYTTEAASGDAAPTIYVQIPLPVSHCGPVKKEDLEAKSQSAE